MCELLSLTFSRAYVHPSPHFQPATPFSSFPLPQSIPTLSILPTSTDYLQRDKTLYYRSA